jgi:hypothetical protein
METDMKVILKMINLTEKENIFTIMEKDMKIIGLMENAVEKAFTISIMEIKLKVNLLNIKPREFIIEI